MSANIRLGCLVVLLISAVNAHAGAPEKAAPSAAAIPEPLTMTDVAAVAASDLEAIEARGRLRPLDGPSNPDPRLNTLRFRDHLSPAVWLRNLKALPLVTFWQSSRMSIFLGLNSKGVPGVHLQQTEPDREDTAVAVKLDEPLPELPVRSLALASR